MKGYTSKSGACESCMGRKVIRHSPPKHPEQDDPYAAMDAMTEKATKSQPGTLKQAREAMRRALSILQFHAGRCPLGIDTNFSGSEEHLSEYRKVRDDVLPKALEAGKETGG